MDSRTDNYMWTWRNLFKNDTEEKKEKENEEECIKGIKELISNRKGN